MLTVTFVACINAAPQKEHFQIRGLLGELDSFSESADGCSGTGYGISVAQNATHDEPGGPVTSAVVSFQLISVNFCTGDLVSLDVGNSDTAVVSGSLQKGIHATASVSGSVSINGGPPTPVTGNLDLIFTPTSKPQRGHSVSNSVSGSEVMHFRTVSNSSDASVSGTLNVDGTDYLAAILAAKEVFASVENIDSATLDIFKK